MHVAGAAVIDDALADDRNKIADAASRRRARAEVFVFERTGLGAAHRCFDTGGREIIGGSAFSA